MDNLTKYKIIATIGLTIGISWGVGYAMGAGGESCSARYPSKDGSGLTSPLPIITETPTPTPIQKLIIKGQASYYSVAGCLGCSDNLTMANGERLSDEVATIALTPEMVRTHKLLNDTVVVTNAKTGKTTTAKVTDTGGFAKYNRVADLSLKTKQLVDCSDLCQVEIKPLERGE